MRKAVPKVNTKSNKNTYKPGKTMKKILELWLFRFQICHNRTGEINPKKIKKLIEAYVAKFRQKRKLQQSSNVGGK